MTFKEKIKKDHQNNVKCFGKVQTIILYILISILILFSCIMVILDRIYNDERFIEVYLMVAGGIAILSIFYIIIISRFEKKEGDKK